MSSSSFYNEYFKNIYIHSSLLGNKRLASALSILKSACVSYIGDKREIPDQDMSSHTIYVDSPKASILAPCPGSRGHVCCNYLTINLYVGCIIGCSYCIMKSYLNFMPIVVNMAVEKTIDEVLDIARANSSKAIRIGTGEVGDSLDLDPVFDLSRDFIRAFSQTRNIFFELKTKTDSIDHIIDIPEKGNAVIGFSVNPDTITSTEDGSGCSLDRRISTARRAIESGYHVSFHFDPIFRYENWEEDYTDTIRRLGSIDEKKVAWISLGTFRYPKGLKDKIDNKWFLYDELVQCADNKFRYVQKTRSNMYSVLTRALQKHFPSPPLYLCMESIHMWKQVFGGSPYDLPELRGIFERARL
jgi:spore photoproduct lyase